MVLPLKLQNLPFYFLAFVLVTIFPSAKACPWIDILITEPLGLETGPQIYAFSRQVLYCGFARLGILGWLSEAWGEQHGQEMSSLGSDPVLLPCMGRTILAGSSLCRSLLRSGMFIYNVRGEHDMVEWERSEWHVRQPEFSDLGSASY